MSDRRVTNCLFREECFITKNDHIKTCHPKNLNNRMLRCATCDAKTEHYLAEDKWICYRDGCGAVFQSSAPQQHH